MTYNLKFGYITIYWIAKPRILKDKKIQNFILNTDLLERSNIIITHTQVPIPFQVPIHYHYKIHASSVK